MCVVQTSEEPDVESPSRVASLVRATSSRSLPNSSSSSATWFVDGEGGETSSVGEGVVGQSGLTLGESVTRVGLAARERRRGMRVARPLSGDGLDSATHVMGAVRCRARALVTTGIRGVSATCSRVSVNPERDMAGWHSGSQLRGRSKKSGNHRPVETLKHAQRERFQAVCVVRI